MLDLAFNHCSVYSNPLRPVVGVLRARKGRRFFEVLKKMMPGIAVTFSHINCNPLHTVLF